MTPIICSICAVLLISYSPMVLSMQKNESVVGMTNVEQWHKERERESCRKEFVAIIKSKRDVPADDPLTFDEEQLLGSAMRAWDHFAKL